jgi:hypothetical protein
MFDQVPDEFFAGFGVELIAGITDTGTIRNEFLDIIDAQFCKGCGGLSVTE